MNVELTFMPDDLELRDVGPGTEEALLFNTTLVVQVGFRVGDRELLATQRPNSTPNRSSALRVRHPEPRHVRSVTPGSAAGDRLPLQDQRCDPPRSQRRGRDGEPRIRVALALLRSQ